MRFAFYTLGCKVNQFETQAMERRVQELGHTVVPFGEPCDCCVVNTCTVTAVSDKKCRAAVRRAKKLSPDTVVGVCGCYAQNDPDVIRALGADVLAGTADRMEFLDLLISAADDRQKRETLQPAREHRAFERLPAGGLAARTRAVLKVEDGCNNFCSYCVIPFARGPVRSLPLAAAVDEARRVCAEGYRELVVTGIEISSWGQDLPEKPQLADLIAAVCASAPQLRIRLGSLEPRTVTLAFCERLAGYNNLCPHFHLSLQSGSDTVLARMRRKYDTARYLESVALLREFFPGCAVTTDVIVGFPGETDEEFAETLAFLDTCGFAACHIFPYSRRPGTAADRMAGQLGNAVKEQRSARAIEAAAKLEDAYLRAMLGRAYDVLWEQPEDGCFAGHTPNYAKVYIRQDGLHNTVTRCTAVERFRDGLLMRPEETQ
ncbi:MAG: tRNA (N(6)-L-threonylcarbamoyladenosine(37)-C(2))-methylthiotransferase MtaB [Oscillospiraceae bacterium]|nr:tRNA (N(6)-L-threonylcarbamoyladenosine(37)-C(2))-methylthiotransferase MtaB [Oscillospiraceae bacterium]